MHYLEIDRRVKVENAYVWQIFDCLCNAILEHVTIMKHITIAIQNPL